MWNVWPSFILFTPSAAAVRTHTFPQKHISSTNDAPKRKFYRPRNREAGKVSASNIVLLLYAVEHLKRTRQANKTTFIIFHPRAINLGIPFIRQ